ncbi:anti-sigma factor [Novosphingobium lentum]|uniref:anti-sigma factor n=1 Tax=Novosphingobium lentum TaxID=145287 RepID=UPI000829BB1E|nr:anti-sigma factor [Novosphingobium lentum]
MNQEDDILAAEYALGLLDGAEREAARRRVAADTALATQVDWWRDHFEPLAAADRVEPSDALWARIEAMLPGNDNAAASAQRWRAAALAATLVAALLGAVIALRPVPTSGPSAVSPAPAPAPVAPAPTLLASLSGDRGLAATIAYDRTSAKLTIVPGKLDTSQHDAELWIIPEGGTARSLGTIDPAHPSVTQARADARALIAQGATFAITLEPRGGSPTGKATGPIVGSGKISGA